MAGKTGRYAIIEQFLADGITHMFGNPGTVEQGFLDTIKDYPEMKYILTLQETIAVAIGDGYARSTKQPTVVQLHSGVGLGNGIGMMYQAMRGHAPLVVIAGEAGIQYDSMDAQMAADLVSMARPVTKWSTRVVEKGSLLRVLRRAIKMACTAPMGPVFVSLPMDILDAEIEEPILPTTRPHTTVSPMDTDVTAIADMLANSRNPMIIMGDGICASGAQAELAEVAELVGAEVWGADNSEVNIPQEHPLYMGNLGHMFGSHSQEITTKADAVLICGTYVFPEVFPAMDNVFAKDAQVMHIDLNAYEIAKNFNIDLGVVADPKQTLLKVANTLKAGLKDDRKKLAADRVSKISGEKLETLKQLKEHDESVKNDTPMHASVFMKALSEKLDDDAIIFDEALTSSPEMTRYIPANKPGTFFQTRGGSLGVGFPGAIGLKLANPDKTVIGFSGDGGSMYTIQAMWTAAHHNVPAKFVVCNNHSYMLLKLNIMQYWKERGIDEHEFPASFTLDGPSINFADLAESMGVKAVRVEKPEEVPAAVEQMLSHDGPFLVDLVITNHVPGSKMNCKCGQ
ncbi:MAG: thiamine pyrophosphate-binding protein [Ectothiorhodospiraceae bacterium]|nr:thiamine pyrophosphate-binding protein [Ectothiorhodospiraceae bacterium]